MTQQNNIQTNQFTGGMNLDQDITIIPNSNYRYAENVRVITDNNGTTGVLQNIQDTKEVDQEDIFNSDEVILKTITVDKYIVVLTVDDKGINRIHRVDNYKDGKLTNVVVVKGDLGYTKEDHVGIVANYESDDAINIYIAVKDKPIKTLNIMSDKYISNSELLDNNGNIIYPGCIDIIPDANLKAPKIHSIIENGSLTSGMVQYAYQLFNINGTQSIISSVSNLVHLTNSSVSEELNQYKGCNKDVNANKSVQISIDLNTDDVRNISFDKVRIFRIKYNDKTEDPVISIIAERDIIKEDTQLLYTDTGSNELSTYTVDEFNRINSVVYNAGTIEKHKNILFAANVKDSTFDVEYDARSYRCDEDGILVLNDGIESRNILKDLSQLNESQLQEFYKSIPENHDCINPYNMLGGNSYSPENGKDNMIYSNVKKNGKRVMGGSGLNVDYQFIYTTVDLDYFYCRNYEGNSTYFSKIAMLPTSTASKYLYRLDAFKANQSEQEIVDLIRWPDNTSGSKYGYGNFANPEIDALYNGYTRDEIYRFGIVFYNDKGQASPVHWIADIRMPDSKGDKCKSTFFSTSYKITGNVLGINFTVRNIPEGVVRYEIVRCNRTDQDKTVVMQAAVSCITEYPYKYINDGEQLQTDRDIRPMMPLANHSRNNFRINYVSLVVHTGKDIDKIEAPYSFTETDYYFENSKVLDNYKVLISPEIDILKEKSLDLLDNAYLQLCYSCAPYATNPSNGVENKYYTNPQYTVKTWTTDRVKSGREILGKVSGDYMRIVVTHDAQLNDEYRDNLTNVTGKRYAIFYPSIPASSDYTKRYQCYNIERNTISANILEQNNITNKEAFYQAIGDKYYLNISHLTNNREEYAHTVSKACYFGNCLVVNGDDLINIPNAETIDNDYGFYDSELKTILSGRTQNPYITPIVNIKRNITPYGGNSYSARQNSTYITTCCQNDSTESNAYVFGGDTRLGILDHRTGSPWPNPETGGGTPNLLQMSITDYIPFETTVNLNLMYGETTSRSCEGNNTYTNPYLATNITGGTVGGYNVQTQPYYAYNDAYNSQSVVKLFVSLSEYTKTNERVRNRIYASETKTQNEVSDSWSKFLVANYLDVDNQYGNITNLKSFRDRLLFWQDDALGVASVKERSLINDNSGAQLTLGTGDILSRFDYITTGNGSDINNDPSIVNSESNVYWYDDKRNEICRYGNSMEKLSKVKQVQSYLNDDVDNKVHDAIYDNKFNEIQMCFNDKVLVYSEYIDAFSSFFTNNPDSHASFQDKLLYLKDLKFTESADFEDSFITSKVQIVINKDVLYTKVFDNVFFGGVFDDIKNMLTEVKFQTKTQVGTILEDYVNGGYAIDHREDTYRFAIGREEQHEDNTSYKGRLRGKYLLCDYVIECNNTKFNLPYINTTYRISLV